MCNIALSLQEVLLSVEVSNSVCFAGDPLIMCCPMILKSNVIPVIGTVGCIMSM